MKHKIFLYFIIAAAAFASCKKDKTVFSETADERVNKLLTSYQDTLANAPNGWKGFVFPGGLNGGVVAFYFKFNNANRVEMFSDFDSISNVTVLQSSYRLKALQQPALIFDTYSYVSVLADPDAAANGGTYGSGLTSDFEFAIDTIAHDTIKLTGRLHSTKAYLVKASKQEMDDYYNKKHSNRAFDNINKYLVYFKRFTVGGVTYEILANTASKTVIITWIDSNGQPHSTVTGYYYTTTGIAFITPIVNGTTTITGLDNIAFNNTTLVMTLSANGTAQTLTSFPRPLVPDLTAGIRWRAYAVANGDWKTQQGFHVNGVDDAFHIQTIANFYYLGFETAFQGSQYDVLNFYKVINNTLTLQYAMAFNPPSTFSNGLTTFQFLGWFGTLPTADSIPVVKTCNQMADPPGYYFVQTTPTSYDMVAARDGKSWVSWFF